MFELIALIAVVLAIAALSSVKGLRMRSEAELGLLRKEIEALKTGLANGQVIAASTPAVSPDEVEATENTSVGESLPDTAEPQQQTIDAPELAAAAAVASEAEDVLAEPAPAQSPSVPEQKRESFESMLAARWSVWVGGIALAFAGIFAVKYSIEQGLLSPAVRLSLAALFGLVLMAAGEWVRRRTEPLVNNAFQNAMIPGILTAAGTITLMGATYVAHAFYGYFGPATAFVLLGIISFSTIGLSLIHGQALAGLGLLASMVSPALVSSEAPNPWALFGFLSVSWIATSLASKVRKWRVVPALANAGLSLWVIAYISGFGLYEVPPATLPLLIMIAGLAFIWPGRWSEPLDNSAEQAPQDRDTVARLMFPRHIASTLTASFGMLAASILMMETGFANSGHAEYGFLALVLALALFGASRTYAIYPAIFAALAALGGFRAMSEQAITTSYGTLDPAMMVNMIEPTVARNLALGLGLLFALLAQWVAFRFRDRDRGFVSAWTAIGTMTPLLLGGVSFFLFGNYSFDLLFGAYGLVLALIYLAGAQVFHGGAAYAGRYDFCRDLLLAASWASLVFVLVVTTDGVTTTLGVAFLGFAYLMAIRLRDWPSLPWGMVLSALFVAGRIAWEPTIVGPDHLGKTPVFNALLVGYGIPTVLLILSAWFVRSRNDDRLKNVLEALASLFALLTLGILVRHAMNGGVLNSATPTLGEQAIYTLLTIGASATLMALDLRRPSIVFRTGSMIVGVISMISVLAAHFGALNPYFTGELTGRIPFFNLLFLAYLLPGIAYGGAALFARSRRPYPYVLALALTGALLLFGYVTLSVRRLFHGEGIADWKGFLQSELYAYSVVWLLLGIVLLVLGTRFRAKSIRIASAVLVLIAVVKVFLIDMSNLEGLYRVLSFIGLGIALIGIGRFYQKVLTGLEKEPETMTAGNDGAGTSSD